MGQRDEGVFGVEARRGEIRKAGEALAVDDLDPVERQLAAALHGFDQAGADKAGIGLAVQHGIDDTGEGLTEVADT